MKKSNTIITVFLIILILGLVGYFVYQNFFDKKETKKEEKEIKEEKENEPEKEENLDDDVITNNWINFIKNHEVKTINYTIIEETGDINEREINASKVNDFIEIFNKIASKTTKLEKLPEGIGFEMRDTLDLTFDNYEISIIDDNNGFAILLIDNKKDEINGYQYELKEFDIFAEFDKII